MLYSIYIAKTIVSQRFKINSFISSFNQVLFYKYLLCISNSTKF